MPEISIERPPTMARGAAMTYGPGIVIVFIPMAIYGVLTSRWDIVAAEVGLLAMIAVLVTVIAPREFQKSRRKNRELLAGAHAGTLFVGMASPLAKRTTRPTRQQTRDRRLLRVDVHGVEWEAEQPDYEAPTVYRWSEMNRVEVRCASPYSGLLELHMADDTNQRWYVFDVPDLIDALDHLNGHSQSPISD